MYVVLRVPGVIDRIRHTVMYDAAVYRMFDRHSPGKPFLPLLRHSRLCAWQ